MVQSGKHSESGKDQPRNLPACRPIGRFKVCPARAVRPNSGQRMVGVVRCVGVEVQQRLDFNG